MYEIIYTCKDCGQIAPSSHRSMLCPKCGGDLKGNPPMITGTRDSFGIGKEFYHKGREITNWRQWEKEGYSDPLSDGTIKDNEMKERVKEKITRVKAKQSTRQDYFNNHPHIGGANG